MARSKSPPHSLMWKVAGNAPARDAIIIAGAEEGNIMMSETLRNLEHTEGFYPPVYGICFSISTFENKFVS